MSDNHKKRTSGTKTDFRRMWTDVQGNRTKLDNCPRHHFPHKDGYRLGDKLTCQVCGGVISLTDAGSYVKGFIAAGGDAADVWPDWKPNQAKVAST